MSLGSGDSVGARGSASSKLEKAPGFMELLLWRTEGRSATRRAKQERSFRAARCLQEIHKKGEWMPVEVAADGRPRLSSVPCSIRRSQREVPEGKSDLAQQPREPDISLPVFRTVSSSVY